VSCLLVAGEHRRLTVRFQDVRDRSGRLEFVDEASEESSGVDPVLGGRHRLFQRHVAVRQDAGIFVGLRVSDQRLTDRCQRLRSVRRST